MRADLYLSKYGYVQSRTKAAELISNGSVTVNGKPVAKSSEDIPEGSKIEIAVDCSEQYVGRGGLKLEAALKYFSVDVKDKKCVDIGSSTGGFTQCLLRYGAEKVYAVDSGSDQLADVLRRDPRVVCIEGFNARELTFEVTQGYVDIAVMDVSFISQTLIYPAVKQTLKSGGLLIALVKPQFEAGRAALNGKGIVKDKKHRMYALKRVISAGEGFELGCIDVMCSPIKGGSGNVEYLAIFKLGEKNSIDDNKLKNVVYDTERK